MGPGQRQIKGDIITKEGKTLVGISFVDDAKMTNACVKSVLSTIAPDNDSVDVLLLSNGSKQGNLNRVKGLYHEHPRVKDIIISSSTASLPTAWNLIMNCFHDHPEYQYLCILHNDVVVNYSMWLTELKLAFENHPGECFMSVARSTTGNCTRAQDATVAYRDTFVVIRNQALKGFCFMLSRDTIDQFGNFDEDYVILPDKDYMLRINFGKGNRSKYVVLATDVKVVHHGNRTFSKLYTTNDYVKLYHEDLQRISKKYI